MYIIWLSAGMLINPSQWMYYFVLSRTSSEVHHHIRILLLYSAKMESMKISNCFAVFHYDTNSKHKGILNEQASRCIQECGIVRQLELSPLSKHKTTSSIYASLPLHCCVPRHPKPDNGKFFHSVILLSLHAQKQEMSVSDGIYPNETCVYVFSKYFKWSKPEEMDGETYRDKNTNGKIDCVYYVTAPTWILELQMCIIQAPPLTGEAFKTLAALPFVQAGNLQMSSEMIRGVILFLVAMLGSGLMITDSHGLEDWHEGLGYYKALLNSMRSGHGIQGSSATVTFYKHPHNSADARDQVRLPHDIFKSCL